MDRVSDTVASLRALAIGALMLAIFNVLSGFLFLPEVMVWYGIFLVQLGLLFGEAGWFMDKHSY